MSSGRRSSSIASELARHRAKLEAAKVREKYLQQEYEMERQKAILDRDLKVLQCKREMEEAQIEMNSLEGLDEVPDENFTDKEYQNLRQVAQERVEEFVQQQSELKTGSEKKEHSVVPNNITLSPMAPAFVPKQDSSNGHINEVSKFLAKKDLLWCRLTKFDDRPEYFTGWKTSFKNIVSELNLTSLEEIELLNKWLGPESARYAQSIRTASVNPDIALARLWERLEDRYGRPEMIEAALKNKLSAFPRLSIKDNKRLYDLVDIVSEIEAAKEIPHLSSLFAYFDSSSGVNPIVSKLPYQIQEKWTRHANSFKESHYMTFPPFHVFCKFLRDTARMKNDPSFYYDNVIENAKVDGSRRKPTGASSVATRKTDTNASRPMDKTEHTQLCPLHETGHSLNSCRAFQKKTVQERREFLRSKGICFKCCEEKHLAKDCQKRMKCNICKEPGHATALHVEKRASDTETDSQVKAVCTQICGNVHKTSKSCAKTLLVNIHHANNPNKVLRTYAIIDEQSNRSLANSCFFNFFGVEGPDVQYELTSCSGLSTQTGRRTAGFIISSLDGKSSLRLPSLMECNYIPNNRDEIPTPEVARSYRHMRDIEEEIPPLDQDAEITLLVGRDLLPAHHILDQRLGDSDSPFAQRLHLGWVVIGEVCYGASHSQESLSVCKTYTRTNGRTSLMETCENSFQLKETDIFAKTKHDDSPGLSIEDKKFVDIMEQGFERDSEGCWCAPLPFRENRRLLPSNRIHALHRANLLTRGLQKDPDKKRHVVEFMGKILDNGHAEIAPPLSSPEEEHWYLPLFAVYHPKKGSVRCVFDSSAQIQGLSLNSILLTGPDLVNSLLGILLRFRQFKVAVTADVEQMFYRFSVPACHRNYLRFFWHKDNDTEKELTEYRMKRHVFGNSASPAVATLGLRRTVRNADEDVRQFVCRNFYVDDGLLSVDTVEEAINLLSKTQKTLKEEGNIRLHKLASNDPKVCSAFPTDDLAKELKDLNLDLDETPLQRTLGVSWNVSTDMFTFQVSRTLHPYTKRGVLATINSLYDPIGFLAPVIVKGKMILRDLMAEKLDWDDPLPEDQYSLWCEWRESLPALEDIAIPRAYAYINSAEVSRRELHIFADASQKAIGAVAYMKTFKADGTLHVGFVQAKAKVAPIHGHTIPRLELCAAVLASQLKLTILNNLDVEIAATTLYSDSKVVLGYINNESRRFYIYVGNRVEKIRQATSCHEWKYCPTDQNPADIATRSIKPQNLQESRWLCGPHFLRNTKDEKYIPSESGNPTDRFPLVDVEQDKEVRPIVKTLHTACKDEVYHPWCERFKNFSSWIGLVRAIARLQHLAQSFNKSSSCVGWHHCSVPKSAEAYKRAEEFIIKAAQREFFLEEVESLMEGREIKKGNAILALSPFLDSRGLLRVGGRLRRGTKSLRQIETCPILIPKGSHLANLLALHCHEQVFHQGRRLTGGKLHSMGFWIVGEKRLINSLLGKCVICKRLRGTFCSPKMAELPEDRLSPGPPFTYVGVDVFGPWSITARKTRGSHVTQKRWAVLFTCLTSRAVHIEISEELSTSSFINAMRRFIAIRGPVKIFRSDRGTNFIGGVKELGMKNVVTEDASIKNFLAESGCVWIFNPPHASHFGGVWERMIGIARRILDGILLSQKYIKDLTHEVLVTLMAEISAVMNSRPIAAISTDPDDPSILAPSSLLTQKVGTPPDDIPQFGIKDIYKSQWQRVQVMADEFWKKWQKEYLTGLQTRRKWATDQPNLKTGDIVLLREYDSGRNSWPTAMVKQTFPGADGRVREVEVRLCRGEKVVTYVRPVHELVPLITD